MKNYSGNLVELRKQKERILRKKHQLSLEIKDYNKLTIIARQTIHKNMYRLSKDIEFIDREIAKIQTAMQNCGQWMDGDFSL